MRRLDLLRAWPALLLAGLILVPCQTKAGGTERFGEAPGYQSLGGLAVLDGGRIKPLDTSARLHLKEIYGRDQLKLESAAGSTETWTALAALVDWPLHPTAWDEREVVLIDMFDYRGFKQLLLAESVKETLRKAAQREGVSTETKSKLETLAQQDVVAEKDLAQVLDPKQITNPDDLAALKLWSYKLAEGRKWIAPADLEAAVVDVDGKSIAFLDWFGELSRRNQAARRSRTEPKFSPRERRVIELGERLVRYQAFRDHNEQSIPELDLALVPRPSSDTYLAYTGQVVQDLLSGHAAEPDSSGLEADVFNTLAMYLTDIKSVNRYMSDIRDGKQKPPGQDPDFDPGFRKWLRQTSGWVPLRLIKTAPIEDLEKAGFDRSLVESFRTAQSRFEEAATRSPGQLDRESAQALVAAARALGESSNPELYPTSEAMARETEFNRIAPFSWAPVAYGIALILFLLSLGIDAPPKSLLAGLGKAFYGLGWVSFLSGVGLEVVGFKYRIEISGWAPVTNMYETVIWVALGAALLGLVLEAINRRKYAITAASGVALLATVLAANVPLLDANIGQLQPVLRDNYWLTVHVLTIVSSYAAFALAMGLGLLGLGYYLSATYRRDVDFRRAILPTLIGIPVLALGIGLSFAESGAMWQWPSLDRGWPGYLAAMIGLFMTTGGLAAVFGELANRASIPTIVVGLVAAAAGGTASYFFYDRMPPSWWPQEAPYWFPTAFLGICGLGLAVLGLIGRGSRHVLARNLDSDDKVGTWHDEREPSMSGSPSLGMASKRKPTPARPSVSEILAKAAQPTPLDARGEAIQYTVARVKPLSNFLYRAMQVGVLLVAAGTILGGVWADVSWGRFWGWDPKEVWALITLLIYLVPLHGRFAGWVSTFGLVAASVFCFGSVLMAWYGVNFVLGVGLHSYGFTEGGGQGVVILTTLVVMSLVLGAGWRRRLGTPKPVVQPAVAPQIKRPTEQPVGAGR